jgi:hypothetical protein
MRKALRALASFVLLVFAVLFVLGAVAHATTTTPARGPRASAPRPVATRHTTADSLARPGSRVAPRTLDDIHIEGEIPVPQVLFITARDQRRFMEFQHHRYTRTSLELGRGTAMPSRVVVPEPGPVVGKENER